MGFGAQGTQAHGTRHKMFHDRFARFNFRNINRRCRLELEEPAQSRLAFGLVVNQLAIDLELLVIATLHRLAERGKGLRRPQVLFAFLAERILTARLQDLACIGKCNLLALAHFAGNFFQADTFDAACRTRQEFLDEFVIQAHGFENLSAAVAAERGDTHLAHNLEQSLVYSLYIICSSRHRVHIQVAVVAHIGDALESEIRVDDRGTVTEKQRKMHHFAYFATLHNQADFRANTRFHQGAVHAGRREERRHRHVAPVDVLVRKHDDVVVVLHRTHGIAGQILQGRFQHRTVTAQRELHLEHLRLERLVADILEATDFIFRHNRARNLNEVRLFRSLF